MSSCEVSAVLFAKDHAKVSAFYRDALGFVLTASDTDHSAFDCGGFEFIVHQIPREFLRESKDAGPPSRREHGAIRLDFLVDSVEAARSMAVSMGGHVDNEPPAWAPRDANIYLGHDPEGNIFKISQREP